MRGFVGLVAFVAVTVTTARGEEKCMYAQQFFSPGAVSCQSGAQYRCTGGSWQAVGSDCSDVNPGLDQPAILVAPGNQAPGVRQPGMPGEPRVPRE